MNLNEANESGNVEDRRGNKKALAIGGGVGAVVITLIAGFVGLDPNMVQKFLGGAGGQQSGPPPEDGYKQFSEKLLGTTNAVWREQFQKNGYGAYQPPGMVLFSEQVDSEGCGVAPSAVGPFYCPRSKKVFLDPTFFQELEKLGGSKAEFSQAYVIAHEVGHHVQNLLGYNERINQFHGIDGEKNAGIRLELQADYLAGVWAKHADQKYHILQSPSEIQEALKTAKAIGDNKLQEKGRGWSSPESFTHGTDTQRYNSFKRGYDTGDSSKQALDYFFNPRVKALDLAK